MRCEVLSYETVGKVYNNIYVECADRDEFHEFYYENRDEIQDYIKWGWQNRMRAKDVAETIMDELYFG